MDLEEQEVISVEAANTLMCTLRAQLEPFRFVVDEKTPWEEKSALARLNCRMKKSKRNELWKKKKRRSVAEIRAKVDEMKAIDKVKAKRERKRLEPELELALIVEEMQVMRSLRIEKLKKQGMPVFRSSSMHSESRVRLMYEEEEKEEDGSSVHQLKVLVPRESKVFVFAFKECCNSQNFEGCVRCLQQVDIEYNKSLKAKLQDLFNLEQQIFRAGDRIP